MTLDRGRVSGTLRNLNFTGFLSAGRVAQPDFDRGHLPKSVMSSQMSSGRTTHTTRVCLNAGDAHRRTVQVCVRACVCVCTHGAEGKRHATEHGKRRADAEPRKHGRATEHVKQQSAEANTMRKYDVPSARDLGGPAATAVRSGKNCKRSFHDETPRFTSSCSSVSLYLSPAGLGENKISVTACIHKTNC